MKRNSIFAIIILSILISAFISAAVPETLNLHGRLTDSSGNTLSGNYNMTFRIYNVSSGGNALYELANQTITTDSGGIYHIILGNVNLTFDEQYYLGIQVENDSEMSPRINLTSSPYTFRAKNISAEGIIADSNLNLTGKNITASTGFFNLAWSYLTNIPNIIYNLWTDNNLDNLLISNGTAIGYNQTILNQSIRNVGIDAGFNSTYNQTYHTWAYNQTTPAITYTDSQIDAINTTTNIQSLINGTSIWLSGLNVTGTSYLGNIIISADNITTNNIISKSGNISFFNSTNSEIVRFLDNGRVGIGTSSPSQKLEVEGNTNITQNLTVLGSGRIEDKTGFVMPVGVIQFYGGSTTPKGWLLCDGTAVSRTTYADLFAVISTTFGAGDGSTTFNLPDLRGKYTVGLVTSGTLGASVGTALTNQENRAVGQHTHTFTGTSSQSTSAGSSHSHGATGLTFTGSALGTHGHTFTGNALGLHGHGFTYANAGWPQVTDPQGLGQHDWSGWGTGPNWMTQAPIVGASAGTPSGTISSVSAGTPSGSIGGSTASESSHTHTITPSGTNANAGSVTGTNAPYIQLNCIIKY